MTADLISAILIAAGVTLLASAALMWWNHTRARRDEWPNWDDIPMLCIRCGAQLPIRDDIDLPDAAAGFVIEYAPIPAMCRAAGIAGWLCGPACAQPWADHHTALHHPHKETRT